jgi:hypothetical protein
MRKRTWLAMGMAVVSCLALWLVLERLSGLVPGRPPCRYQVGPGHVPGMSRAGCACPVFVWHASRPAQELLLEPDHMTGHVPDGPPRTVRRDAPLIWFDRHQHRIEAVLRTTERIYSVHQSSSRQPSSRSTDLAGLQKEAKPWSRHDCASRSVAQALVPAREVPPPAARPPYSPAEVSTLPSATNGTSCCRSTAGKLLRNSLVLAR